MTRTVQIISLVFTLLLGTTAAAQSHRIIVQVLSKDNGQPLEYMYVNLYNETPEKRMETVMTDEKGHATISISQFPATIEAVGIGYEMERIRLHQAPTETLTMRLSKSFASLNEVVITGVARPTKPLDALSNYKVITEAQMQAQGAKNVQDAISYQLNTISNNDGALGATIKMQGMDGNKVKILIDGVPINGRENGNIDLGQLNTYNLERIEIIQGPMSVMYGTDAIGGVINLISKNQKNKFGVSGEAHYETIGKYNLNASLIKSIGKHHFTLGGGRNYFDGAIDVDTVAPFRRQAFKPKEQYLGNFNYQFSPSEKITVRFSSDFVRERLLFKGAKPNYITPYEGYAYDERYINTRSLNRLSLNGKLGKEGQWQMINGYSYYHRTRNEYKHNLVTLTDSLTENINNVQDTTTFHEYSFRGMYDNKVFKTINYTLGYDIDLQKGHSRKIPGNYRSIHDYALFTTLSMPIFQDKVIAQAGLRASYNTAYTAPPIPSFNLLYKYSPHVSIRASYAKGFRAPTLKELYLDFVDNNHMIFGNSKLQAEKADHLQASASWMVFEKESNYAQILITGYYNNVYNQIALAPRYPNSTSADSAQWDYTNITRMRNTLATVEFEGQYSNFHYKLGYGYSYTLAQGSQYNGFDAHEFTTTLQYFWKWSKLYVSVFNKLNGARPILISNVDGTSSYSGRQPLFDMMDVSLSRKFWKQNIQLTIGVKNVFDVVGFQSGSTATSTHGSASSINFMPRSFFTTLRLNVF